jgi:rod shape-determining protein MreC
VIALVFASLALMILDHHRQLGQPVRSAGSLAAYPIQWIVNLPFQTFGFFSEQLASRRTLIEENARLRAQHLLYDVRLQRLDSLERENISLRDLLQSSYQVSEPVLIAELIQVDLDPYTHLIKINKGTLAGLYQGQPVLDARGIMGQVDNLDPLTATVRLITDPSHAIPVEVNRNGLRAVALGTGDSHRLELTSLPNNTDIQVGDLLVSSGLGGRFPQGYPVAHVIEVQIDPGRPFARVIAEPTARLDRSREMLLVRARQQPSATAANPTSDGGAP